MDDVAAGGSEEDVKRMKGSQDGSGEWDGSITKILSLGGFKAKALVVGGNCTEEEAETMGGKFLGIGYEPHTDMIAPFINPKCEWRRAREVDKKKEGLSRWMKVSSKM